MARALVDIFILIYGNFIQLQSDQGTEFNNEVFEQISKLLEIKQTFATAYHPQTMGALERNHKCLNEYLRSFTNAHHSDWDDWTKFYAFSYYTTPNTNMVILLTNLFLDVKLYYHMIYKTTFLLFNQYTIQINIYRN